MNHLLRRLLMCTLALLLPTAAHAYIDPNAGGMLFQLLAPVFAAAVGAWLFLRRWITERIKAGWRWLTGRSNP